MPLDNQTLGAECSAFPTSPNNGVAARRSMPTSPRESIQHPSRGRGRGRRKRRGSGPRKELNSKLILSIRQRSPLGSRPRVLHRASTFDDRISIRNWRSSPKRSLLRTKQPPPLAAAAASTPSSPRTAVSSSKTSTTLTSGLLLIRSKPSTTDDIVVGAGGGGAITTTRPGANLFSASLRNRDKERRSASVPHMPPADFFLSQDAEMYLKQDESTLPFEVPDVGKLSNRSFDWKSASVCYFESDKAAAEEGSAAAQETSRTRTTRESFMFDNLANV